MIINNAASRCSVGFWTNHLQDTRENDRAELKQIRGLKSAGLEDALLEMQREAAGRPRLKNFMYHADFNPPPAKRFTEKEWERSFEIFEQERGIPAGTPRVVFEHEKQGRVHRHVIWSRLDPENMRAFADGLDARVAHAAARKIELEFGLEQVIGPFDLEAGMPRPPRGPKPWEMHRGMKTGIDPRDVTAEVSELFRQSESGKAFQAALKSHGYELATGDRGLLILDSAGKEHSLARRIEGVKTRELNAFMRDVDRQTLPTVELAKAQYQERKIAGLEADRATVTQQIEWEEALAKAAIAKEEKERQFVERPQPVREGGGREKEAQPAMPDRELNDIQGQIRLAFSLSQSAEGFVKNLEELSQREPQWEEYRPGKYRIIGDRVASIARVTQEEAVNSRIDRTYAGDRPGYVPVCREGDYVVVTERGDVYALDRATGRHRDEIEKFMATADPKAVPTLTQAQEFLERRVELYGIERQAFGDISASAVLEEGISTAQLTRAGLAAAQEAMAFVPETTSTTAQTISRAADIAAAPLEGVAKLATGAIEMLADMFGAATPPPPEIIRAAADAREQAAEQARDFFARAREDDDADRRKIEGREAEKIAEEESRYYQKKREREYERER